MFREATTFAGHLRTVEKDLTSWQRDIESEWHRWLAWSGCPRAAAPVLASALCGCIAPHAPTPARGAATSPHQPPAPPTAPLPAASYNNFRTIMLSPLPRVYEEGHSGQAVPSEPEPSMIGGDVQVERLTSAAQETKKRLDVEVIQPVKAWMVAYRTIAVRVQPGLAHHAR
jgi:hypothetical protein